MIPVHNEEQVLIELSRRLGLVAGRLSDRGVATQVIFVDDGSTDSSAEIIRGLAAQDTRLSLLCLSRNFGHQAALIAGIDAARGDAVIVMDADLQDPPELITNLVDAWILGNDVVYATRRSRSGDGLTKRMTANLFYRTVNHLSETPLPLNVGDYRLMDRIVVDALRTMPEKSLYLRGMVAWLGFRQTSVEFDRDARFAGATKYTWPKMLRLASDAILSFSDRPLRLTTTIGLVSTLISLLLSVFFVLSVLVFDGQHTSGWLSLIVAVFFMGGVQLVCLGIVGQYIGRIYRETKGRPSYLVDERSSIRR